MPENPTLAEYDAQHNPVVAALFPKQDPRVVALQALVDAEQDNRTAAFLFDDAKQAHRKSQEQLDTARAAYVEAMARTPLT
ncbi:hypothetical protein [Klenkia brasiliensis]|uniref:Uncharacterized protein n=1 Tax=Klenkia brasiliensis TaxID=333142 RepID=A0A1G7YH07_9ACTN|nr:hypothetical protein [Klenkia brasiliensis]SDG95828.1 hypothetical protein SAMN05660324_3958 [Klenkia brasiliensis]